MSISGRGGVGCSVLKQQKKGKPTPISRTPYEEGKEKETCEKEGFRRKLQVGRLPKCGHDM